MRRRMAKRDRSETVIHKDKMSVQDWDKPRVSLSTGAYPDFKYRPANQTPFPSYCVMFPSKFSATIADKR
jgi:hypothetical protein